MNSSQHVLGRGAGLGAVALLVAELEGVAEQLDKAVAVAPGERVAGAFGWRRHVGGHHLEELGYAARGMPASSASLPPGRVTRASSAAAARWSGVNITPKAETTTSNSASG